MANLKGVDLSHWQGHVDFEAIVKAGYAFVFVKLTEGTTVTDPNGVANVKAAQKAGLMVGGYHFFHGSPKEVNHFRSVAKNLALNYVILDSEDNSLKGDLTQVSLAFLQAVSDLGKPVFYSNPSYIKAHYNKAITKYPLWIAHYGVDNPDVPFWEGWSAWQYDDKGKVPGIDGAVDLNYMDESLAVKKVVKPKPTPKPTSYTTHVVKKGEVLSVIGANEGVDWREIAKINGIKDPYIIYPDQKLKIPAGAKSTPQAEYHTVVKGDTSWDIAQHYHTTVAALQKLNPSIKDMDKIFPGQKMRVK